MEIKECWIIFAKWEIVYNDTFSFTVDAKEIANPILYERKYDKGFNSIKWALPAELLNIKVTQNENFFIIVIDMQNLETLISQGKK